MSREELVTAYAAGAISRRVFIRRLVAGGVSLGAAVSYAHLLAPERASAAKAPHPEASGAPADFYNAAEINLQIKSKDLDKVAKKKELRVAVEANEGVAINLSAEGKFRGNYKLIGQEEITFDGAGRKVVDIHLNKRGRKAAKRREKLKTRVIAAGTDFQGDTTVEQLTRKITD
jgi:hypothetical protein